MQLLRATDPACIPESTGFACPNGCLRPVRVQLSWSRDEQDRELVFLHWPDDIRCGECQERMAPAAVEEAVARQLGPLLKL